MVKNAIILAGGKGTRLKEVSETIPKPMMPVAGKPLLAYQIELCKKYGITDVTLIVNHLKDSIISHFGHGENWGVNIHYYIEETPLGTVGGIKAIEEKLNDNFLVLYGDVLMDMDLERLFTFHKNKNSDATLVVHPNDHPYDSDLVESDDHNRVTHFHAKPHPENTRYHNLVNAAAYIFSPAIFKFLEKGVKADFGKDIFPNVLDKLNVFAYNTSEYLKDMGTPDRLEKVTRDVLSGKVANRSLQNKQKAIFLDRDGVINYDTDLIHKTEDFTLYPFAAKSIKRINQSEYIAVVITNQSIIARGLTNLKGLDEIHKKMEWQLGEQGAFLDAIYFCPHHPHGGFEGEVKAYKVDCDCRKPKPGMLLEAAKRFNIDLSKSFMIGDSERDAGAGRAAGVTTIGVKTGHGIKNAQIEPHFFLENLEEAVDFILDQPLLDSVEKVKQLINSLNKKTTVVAIAGNTRSGKSTISTALQRDFEQNGKLVLKINLDDWILPKDQRQGQEDVFENFQMEKLESDLANILAGNAVCIDRYMVHHKRKPQQVTYQFQDQELVILDGVVALGSGRIRALADVKVFLDIDDKTLKERFENFYRWKEYDEKELETLFTQRQKNEYDIIAKHRIFADLVL